MGQCVASHRERQKEVLVDISWIREIVENYQASRGGVGRFKSFVLEPINHNFAVENIRGDEDDIQRRHYQRNEREGKDRSCGVDIRNRVTADFLDTRGKPKSVTWLVQISSHRAIARECKIRERFLRSLRLHLDSNTNRFARHLINIPSTVHVKQKDIGTCDLLYYVCRLVIHAKVQSLNRLQDTRNRFIGRQLSRTGSSGTGSSTMTGNPPSTPGHPRFRRQHRKNNSDSSSYTRLESLGTSAEQRSCRSKEMKTTKIAGKKRENLRNRKCELVVEDVVAPNHFQLPGPVNLEGGLDLKMMRLAVTALAQFHASSLSWIGVKEDKVLEQHPYLRKRYFIPVTLRRKLLDRYERLTSLLEPDDLPPNFHEKLEMLKIYSEGLESPDAREWHDTDVELSTTCVGLGPVTSLDLVFQLFSPTSINSCGGISSAIITKVSNICLTRIERDLAVWIFSLGHHSVRWHYMSLLLENYTMVLLASLELLGVNWEQSGLTLETFTKQFFEEIAYGVLTSVLSAMLDTREEEVDQLIYSCSRHHEGFGGKSVSQQNMKNLKMSNQSDRSSFSEIAIANHLEDIDQETKRTSCLFEIGQSDEQNFDQRIDQSGSRSNYQKDQSAFAECQLEEEYGRPDRAFIPLTPQRIQFLAHILDNVRKYF